MRSTLDPGRARRLHIASDRVAAAGRDEDAAGALAEALDRYERKQNIPLACQVRERLAELKTGAGRVS